ncbi:hypothetical protein [Virgibacillus oceani]|uniref:DUF2642 domain-containing protein n=1 Tax=Virgibacillus oceani TaxID=1479511 RepID=A0A917HD79_9BACI|nr:hypothetical protein [Virgibacillus oceani]GGG75565.1 hypothetical protein GCM10011398_20530 [Virgibacillus oceani]
MFANTFAAELATRIGSSVEVATDSNLVEGILSTVTAELVLVIDINTGYGNTKIYLSLDSINFIRFPQTA